MTNLVSLHFDVIVYCQDELAEDLCKDLALFLQESWFNGEDVLEVKCKGYDLIN